eukprot:TRINITY_DN1371_c1_g1_i1.p1 TRINITY_DN1371_c1_g1~~TRINITY_DN1371_c1_g1_i1.p1  ORF type:complete len:622 (+),score=194.71 TRINITY_DN1371_c1_g1_i1:169-2034(+)
MEAESPLNGATNNSLPPLSSRQKKERKAVLDAFVSFWDNQLDRLQHEEEASTFSRNEVLHLLEVAAEIVVRLRTDLDAAHPTDKLRVRAGQAREYFWQSQQKHIHPRGKQFLRGLVHASLSDNSGYVEGVNKAAIESMINTVFPGEESDSQLSLSELISEEIDQVRSLLSTFGSLEADEYENDREPQLREALEKVRELKELLEEITMSDSASSPDATSDASAKDIEMSEAPVEEEPSPPSSASSGEEKDDDSMDIVDENSVADDLAHDSDSDSMDISKSLRRSDSVVVKLQKIGDDANITQQKILDLKAKTESIDLPRLIENPEEGDKIVSNLLRRALQYSEELMTDILSLDEITTSETSRPMRKEKVMQIKGIMNGVDAIKTELVDLQKKVREEKDIRQKQREAEELAQREAEMEIEKERKLEEEKLEEERLKKAEEERLKAQEKSEQLLQERIEAAEKLEEELFESAESPEAIWRDSTFEPQFSIDESRKGFNLKASVPGLKTDELKVVLGKNDTTITISGYRPPSKKELQLMISRLQKLRMSHGWRQNRFDSFSDEELLLKIADGHFGTFTTTYKLPPGTDIENIQCQYNSGILNIDLPRSQAQYRRRMPNFRGNYLW